MFLMPLSGWIVHRLGNFVLEPEARRPWMARLVLYFPAAGMNSVRYRKGTIALSDIRDYPLLRRVLHCGFVTSISCTSS